LREYPFSSASTSEDLPRIKFDIKELGDFTVRIGPAGGAGLARRAVRRVLL